MFHAYYIALAENFHVGPDEVLGLDEFLNAIYNMVKVLIINNIVFKYYIIHLNK